MRVMVMIKGTGTDEGKITPDTEMLGAMNAYNEELVKAGIWLDAYGLKPTSVAAQVVFEGGTTSVVDGPFAEAKEVVAGYWIWEVTSLAEAVEWAKRCPHSTRYGTWQAVEVRPIFEAGDFGEELTPELREREAATAEHVTARRD